MKGFSLMELMIVIAIVGIIAAVGLAAYSDKAALDDVPIKTQGVK